MLAAARSLAAAFAFWGVICSGAVAVAQDAPPPPEAVPVYVGGHDFHFFPKTPPPNVISWNGASLLQGFISFEYERALGRWFSVFGSPNLYVFDSGYGRLAKTTADTALTLDVGMRIYLSDWSPRGFWLSPKIGGGYTSSDEGKGSLWGVSASLGYNWIFGDVFLLSVGGGMGYQNANVLRRDSGKVIRHGWIDTRITLGCVF